MLRHGKTTNKRFLTCVTVTVLTGVDGVCILKLWKAEIIRKWNRYVYVKCKKCSSGTVKCVHQTNVKP